MESLEIMRNISRLPLSQQMLIAEHIIQSIRKKGHSSLESAAELMYEDYMTDANLLSFTQLEKSSYRSPIGKIITAKSHG
jgi:hypothetical protein